MSAARRKLIPYAGKDRGEVTYRQVMRRGSAFRSNAGLPQVDNGDPPDADALAAKRLIPVDTRDFNARFFGDPLPSRSALAQRKSKC